MGPVATPVPEYVHSNPAAVFPVTLNAFLPVSQSIYAHWAKSTELLDLNVVRACRLQRWLQRLSRHLGFAHLCHGWVARVLCCERLFVGIELRLFPDVDPVLRRSRIYIIQ